MITEKGLNLLKKFEGFSEKPYVCSGGKLTIGYGHVIKDNEQFPVPLSEETAEELLLDDVAWAEQCIFDNVKVDLLPCQFDALTSFIFNVGVTAFKNSTLLKKLNASEYENAGREFLRWVYANGKKIKGLEKRRALEKSLFDNNLEL